jgi:hypothetical protein
MKMKKIYLLILILLSVSLLESAEKKSSEFFRRAFESAHPTPVKMEHRVSPGWLLEESGLPYFLNADATMDENPSDPNPTQNESSIAVNPTNPLNLIASAVDYRANSSTWVYVSHDGGKTWENINLGKPFANWRSTNDPSVKFDANGIGYLMHGGFGETGDGPVLFGENGVFIARTTDEGNTWEAHIPVILHRGPQTLDSTFEDKYYVHVDNSPDSPYFTHVYTPWKRVTPRDSATEIVISKSVDNGENWSEPLRVSERLPGSSEDTTFGQSFPLIETGPAGEIYCVWNHGIEHGIGFVKSTDGGASFTEPKIIFNYDIFGETMLIPNQGYRHTVKGGVRAEAYPVIAVDITNGPRRGYIYLCWAADNYPNVYFARSEDGGDTWTDPVIVHSDTTNDQFWPWMAVDPTNGELGIMYLDSREDEQNLLTDVYVSFSDDGGDTWIDRKASDVSFDLRRNPFAYNAFAGDYSGCAFYDGIIYPSWVDMRNTEQQLADNDVYTAIINTRAPAPPDNFEVEIIPEDPYRLNLKWEAPTEYAFGSELADEDYQLRILRNGEEIATLPGGTSEYSDTGLTPFEETEYSIYTVTESDSSIARMAASFPGGSKQPAAPVLASAEISDNTFELEIEIPEFRTDGVTPLANITKLFIYTDSEFFGELEVTSDDAGKTETFTAELPEAGWYFFAVSLVEEFGDGITNESPLSNELFAYVGEPVDDVSENFDNELPKYFIRGGWQTSSEIFISPPNSFTHSPEGKYENDKRDTLIFYPVYGHDDENTYLSIEFRHAAQMWAGDSANVKISFDGGKSFELAATFSRRNYEPWRDGELMENDFKYEELKIEEIKGETVTVMFETYSNPVVNDLGWYLDDILIRYRVVSVNDATPVDFSIYPNPASQYINISGSIRDLAITDVYGNKIEPRIINYGGENSSIDVSGLAEGVYMIYSESDKSGTVQKFVIAR